MVMPHGIELWGGENLHDTTDGPFKYYAGIGTFDTDNYYSRGISNQRIINANLPWFSHQRFKTSFLKSRTERKKSALLLPLDTGFSMHINANTIHNYILNMISALKECNIEVHGIKFRTIDELEAFGFKNGKTIIRGEEFNVFAGYGDLHNFFNDIDMVVGPISSATVECALANIDYYSFQDFSIYDNNPNIFQSIKNVIEIATKKEELVINIKEQKIYKNGFSVKSLVNTYKDFNESCKKLDDILIEIAVK